MRFIVTNQHLRANHSQKTNLDPIENGITNLDHCVAQNKTNPIYLYWGARDNCQLYAKEELVEIADKLKLKRRN